MVIAHFCRRDNFDAKKIYNTSTARNSDDEEAEEEPLTRWWW